jgi:hypothetical protein
MSSNNNLRWILLFAALRFFGSALFYSPVVGLSANIGLECPVCPNISGIWTGSRFVHYVRLTLGGGLLNAPLFILIGWFFLFAIRALNSFRQS